MPALGAQWAVPDATAVGAKAGHPAVEPDASFPDVLDDRTVLFVRCLWPVRLDDVHGRFREVSAGGVSPEGEPAATIHGFGQIAGVLTILPLSDRLGRRTTVLISNLAIALALTGILFVGRSWLLLGVLVGLLAVFYGATFPALTGPAPAIISPDP